MRCSVLVSVFLILLVVALSLSLDYGTDLVLADAGVASAPPSSGNLSTHFDFRRPDADAGAEALSDNALIQYPLEGMDLTVRHAPASSR